MGDQEFDIVKVIFCMTKYAEMVTTPQQIRYSLGKVFSLNGKLLWLQNLLVQ